MNVRKSVVRLLIVALAMLLMIDAKAQYSYRFQDDLGVYEVIFTPADKSTSFASPIAKPLHPKSHEVRLSFTSGGADNIGVSVYGSDINFYSIGDYPDYPSNAQFFRISPAFLTPRRVSVMRQLRSVTPSMVSTPSIGSRMPKEP